MNYKKLDTCVACGLTELEPFLDLDEQPLANNYHSGEGGGDSYPLALNVCKSCWHTQLSVSVDPKILFEHYLYVTGMNETIKAYSKSFAEMVNSELYIDWTPSVLDIACNDGTQLDEFKKLGFDTHGVDPAKNLAELSKDRGHNITVDFWPTDLERHFDVITAQNVCAHTPDPLQFLIGVANHLLPTGTAYIQTSQSQMYQNSEFDTVYHEHISFFSTNSMKVLAKRAGLTLVDVKLTSIHGTSYVFVLKHSNDIQNSVPDMISTEIADGRYNLDFYRQFGEKADAILTKLNYVIESLKLISPGVKIVGYGAAAKGMTVLNAKNIQLDWIVDDSPHKVGLFTPGTNIEIKDRSSLNTTDKIIVIPLAWNFFDEIKANVEEIRGKDETRFIKYFPEVGIE